MKKIILSVAVCLFSTAAFCQTSDNNAPVPNQSQARMHRQMQPAEERAKAYTNELKSVLNLTDDQYAKVMAVNTECIKRKDAMRQSGGNGADNASGFKEIAQYRRQQFQTILTPTQLQQLKNYQMSRPEHEVRAPKTMGNGGNGGQ